MAQVISLYFNGKHVEHQTGAKHALLTYVKGDLSDDNGLHMVVVRTDWATCVPFQNAVVEYLGYAKRTPDCIDYKVAYHKVVTPASRYHQRARTLVNYALSKNKLPIIY